MKLTKLDEPPVPERTWDVDSVQRGYGIEVVKDGMTSIFIPFQLGSRRWLEIDDYGNIWGLPYICRTQTGTLVRLKELSYETLKVT